MAAVEEDEETAVWWETADEVSVEDGGVDHAALFEVYGDDGVVVAAFSVALGVWDCSAVATVVEKETAAWV